MCALRLGVDVPGMVVALVPVEMDLELDLDLRDSRRESLLSGFWSLSRGHSGQPGLPCPQTRERHPSGCLSASLVVLLPRLFRRRF